MRATQVTFVWNFSASSANKARSVIPSGGTSKRHPVVVVVSTKSKLMLASSRTEVRSTDQNGVGWPFVFGSHMKYRRSLARKVGGVGKVSSTLHAEVPEGSTFSLLRSSVSKVILSGPKQTPYAGIPACTLWMRAAVGSRREDQPNNTGDPNLHTGKLGQITKLNTSISLHDIVNHLTVKTRT